MLISRKVLEDFRGGVLRTKFVCGPTNDGGIRTGTNSIYCPHFYLVCCKSLQSVQCFASRSSFNARVDTLREIIVLALDLKLHCVRNAFTVPRVSGRKLDEIHKMSRERTSTEILFSQSPQFPGVRNSKVMWSK